MQKYPVSKKVTKNPRGSTVTESYPSTGYKTFTWRPDYDADEPKGSSRLTKKHPARKKVS